MPQHVSASVMTVPACRKSFGARCSGLSVETRLRRAVLDAQDLDSEQAGQPAVHRRRHALAQGIHGAGPYMALTFRSVQGSLTDEQVRDGGAGRARRAAAEFASQLGELAVVIEDSHPDNLMGIYDPVGGMQRIVIFRDANPRSRRCAAPSCTRSATSSAWTRSGCTIWDTASDECPSALRIRRPRLRPRRTIAVSDYDAHKFSVAEGR